jgi:hypothetical protein
MTLPVFSISKIKPPRAEPQLPPSRQSRVPLRLAHSPFLIPDGLKDRAGIQKVVIEERVGFPLLRKSEGRE